MNQKFFRFSQLLFISAIYGRGIDIASKTWVNNEVRGLFKEVQKPHIKRTKELEGLCNKLTAESLADLKQTLLERIDE